MRHRAPGPAFQIIVRLRMLKMLRGCVLQNAIAMSAKDHRIEVEAEVEDGSEVR